MRASAYFIGLLTGFMVHLMQEKGYVAHKTYLYIIYMYL